jgi:hypothetical protein
MSENQTPRSAADATPESLMDNFKGPTLMKIVVITLVVHVVVLVGSSGTFLWKQVVGDSKLSKEEKIKLAVDDATKSLQKIATKHDLTPQDITSQFGGSRRAPKPVEVADPVTPTAEPERERSSYETNLETSAKGPEMPGAGEAEEEDIF